MSIEITKRGHVKSIEKVLHNYSFIDIEVDLQSKPEPGQFIMIQTTGTSEIPMAIMDYQNGILKIGNKSVGKSTERLLHITKNDEILVRGPYGTFFNTEKSKHIIAIAGGIGLTPIYMLAKERKKKNLLTDVYLAFRTKKEKVLQSLFSDIAHVTEIHIDEIDSDISSSIYNTLKIKKHNLLVTSGPEGFMKNIYNICKKVNFPSQYSIERYMRCGIGICGSCIIDGDDISLRLCIEGPVVEFDVLSKLTDFGELHYDESATKQKI